MKKRWLSILLSVCMVITLLPSVAVTAGATEHSEHGDGWTAVTMGTTYIKLGDVEQTSNTLTEGNYYLGGDLTLAGPLYIGDGNSSSGMVTLCLNGYSITTSSTSTDSSGSAIYMNDEAKLTIVDCGTTAGTVTGSSYGIYMYDDGTLYISGGTITGGTYGIYNNSPSWNEIYLSGSPTVTGTTAGIYNSSGSSKIYANDGAAENPTAYSGSAISLAYSYLSNGNTAVYNVTDSSKFTLMEDNGHYELAESNDTLKIQGKPQTLTWYDKEGNAISDSSYPATWTYGTYLSSSDLPAAPAVDGKIFLGWLYRSSGSSSWSTSYWSSDSVYSAKEFKADYIDSFAGSGTESDPYQIATAADLQKLATVVNKGAVTFNDSSVWYQLTADIDLSTVCGANTGNWIPIGNSSNYFKANFDGNNKTISSLYINTSSSYQGLFGYLDGATVKNMALTGSVSGGDNSGTVAGKIVNSTIESVDATSVTTAPYGYTTDADRTMAYKKDSYYPTTIDIKGNYRDNWIKTTYSNYGYEVANANLTGATVTASADFVNGGKYIQLSYTVTAGTSAITNGKLAVHSDVMIGSNDRAAVEVIQDASGKVIGLKMVDDNSNNNSYNAQFNLYFDGTGGVTPVDTYWFGYYSDRDNSNSTYGYIYFAPLNDSTKSSSGTYTTNEDGVYTKLSGIDSGFAVSWQNINLEAGQSQTFSFILGVGEKSDPPQWNSGSAVSLTLAAEVEQNNRLVNVSAKVKDAAGLTDTLYYSVDGGEGHALGSVEADGSTMKAITGQLDLSSYGEGSYTFSFWVVNSKGAASASVERSITITASGIEGLDSGDEPDHTHNWSTWGHDSDYHWKNCTADGCDITDNSQKDSYGAHVYDDDGDTTCNTCGYTREVEPSTPTYDISGTVTDSAAGTVIIKLMQGNTPIGDPKTVTLSEHGGTYIGAYSFTGVKSGAYNVVATKDDRIVTILVTVASANATEQNLAMPAENVNSKLEITGDNTPDVVVGGLDAEAQEVKTASPGAASVTITMTVESKAETDAANVSEIQSAAPGKTLEYLDIKVEKKLDAADAEPMATTTTVFKIVIPFDKGDKQNITVYRYHGSSVDIFEEGASNAVDGEYIEVSDTAITIYAKKFSTYAIGYTEENSVTPPPTTDTSGGSTTYTITGADTDNGKLTISRKTASKGTTVTITVTPDGGYVLSGLTVTDKSGKEIAVTEKNGKYTFTMPASNVTVAAIFGKAGCPKDMTCPISTFADADVNAWYHDGAHYCLEQDLMKGLGDGRFAPEEDTSRAMIIVMLWRLNGSPVVNYALDFEDVAEDAWYTEAVRWAKSEGVAGGYGNGKFGPDDTLTREQMVAMLHRYAQYKGCDVGVGEDTNILSFGDVTTVAEYAISAMQWACGSGVVGGKDAADGSGLILDPTGSTTRAEMATMMMRFCAEIVK